MGGRGGVCFDFSGGQKMSSQGLSTLTACLVSFYKTEQNMLLTGTCSNRN